MGRGGCEATASAVTSCRLRHVMLMNRLPEALLRTAELHA